MNGYLQPAMLIPDLGFRLLGPRIKECNLMLDIGGGPGLVGMHGWQLLGVQEFTVLDAYDYANPQAGVVFINGFAQDLLNIFGPDSFDIVQCTEVIEHLEKEEGHKLLEDMKQVARHLVIMTCPRGFMKQDPSCEEAKNEPWANNPYQLHKTGWLPEEFFEHGYQMEYNPRDEKACQLIPYWVREILE